MYFEKYHGTGNDFIIIEDYEERDNIKPNELARKVCDRHFGIGADGLIIVKKSRIADVMMKFYNQDGSEAPMCGNGIRCFSKYVYDHKIVYKKEFNVETLAGIMKVEIKDSGDRISNVRINLGKPEFNTSTFPIHTDKKTYLNQEVEINQKFETLSVLNMGTIHTVLFKDHISTVEINQLGAIIETHELFPEKTNVNFCEVIDQKNLSVITYERGVGTTLACGTGCAATAVISHIINGTEPNVFVHVKGGCLYIDYKEDRSVYMTGPAERICKGEYEYKIKYKEERS